MKVQAIYNETNSLYFFYSVLLPSFVQARNVIGGGALSLTAPNVNSRSTANLARLRDEKFNFSFKEILYETTRYHSKFSFSGFPEN